MPIVYNRIAGGSLERLAALSDGIFAVAMTLLFERRILIAQLLYAFGALLCVVNTYCSLGFILLVQLNYAVAPRIKPFSRI